MANQALADLKVLEFGEFVSAPYAAKLLGDYGAEVIKVEEPPAGDLARRHGPFPNDIPHPERSGLFLYLNTNKQGITLDHRSRSGRELFLKLVEQADIVVENRMPGQMKEWGLDYQTLSQVNPRIIMTSISAFGQDGPYKGYKAHAINVASMAGITYRIGDPAREPLTTPLSRSDFWSGINAAAATLMAMFARRRTGEGQLVDVSAVESMSTFMSTGPLIDFVETGSYPRRAGPRITVKGYPWVFLPCKDGFYFLVTVIDRHWQRFVELMGNPAWSENPRYQDRITMGREYPEEVDELVKPWLAQYTKKELWEMCYAKAIPFQPVQTLEEVYDSDHLAEREFFVEVDHPDTGPLKYAGAPFKLSQTPVVMRRPAPRLGEHNEAVYCDRLGLSRENLVDLRCAGVI